MYFVTSGEIYYLSALLLLARHGKILANISSPHIMHASGYNHVHRLCQDTG